MQCRVGVSIETSSTANAVPLLLQGEGLNAPQIMARLSMSGATLTYCGERSVAALPGGAKPFAGRVGWRGLPLRTIYGADSGFRRTLCIHPRRAQRKAQVCGEVMVQSNGRWAGSPHPPQAVPLPLRGEGLNAPKSGRDCPVGRDTFSILRYFTSAQTLREGERVRRSPHPPRSGPPSPKRQSGVLRVESGDKKRSVMGRESIIEHFC